MIYTKVVLENEKIYFTYIRIAAKGSTGKAVQENKEKAPIVATVTGRVGEQPRNNGPAVLYRVGG